MAARVTVDEQFSLDLRDKLELCKDLLDFGQHPPDGLVYTVTGMMTPHPFVNFRNAVHVAHMQMISLERT